MPTPAAKTSRKRAKASSKARLRPLPNAALLKLAAKHRPPQSWYDENIDPTKPERSPRRER